jgi:hypothetical protein
MPHPAGQVRSVGSAPLAEKHRPNSHIFVLLKANYSHFSFNFGCSAMVPYLPEEIINQKNEPEIKLYVI